jgi:alpha-N-arabinofuranosidase
MYNRTQDRNNATMIRNLILVPITLCLVIASQQASAQSNAPMVLTPLTKQATPTRPLVLGQNMTAIDWHGIRGSRGSVFYDPKTHQLDPSWLPLLQAFPMRLLRWHWGNDYNWKNCVGPLDQRKPIKHDMWNAWFNTEPGLDEFLSSFGSLPQPPQISLIASPFRPVDELADLVAYCNATSGPMAKWRQDNGHALPYNVKIWEMGNEIDFKKRADVDVMRQESDKEKSEKMSVADYMQLVKPRIAAMKHVDPTIKIYVHAQTAPWYNSNPDWPLWHQTLLKEMGDQIDGIVIHPYYDGYTVPICLRSVDQVLKDIKQLAPKDHPITVWVNEHARWVNYKNVEERPQSWSLQGALSSADFLIELMKRPGVGMANYWCYGHRGPWRVINANWEDDATQKFGTAIHGMFRIFDQALLPIATPVQVDDLNIDSHPRNYTYNVSAIMFSDPATQKLCLMTINRNETLAFDARITLPYLPNSLAKQWVLTGESLRSTNVPLTPDATAVTQQVVQTQQDANGSVTVTIPARSVALWRWE